MKHLAVMVAFVGAACGSKDGDSPRKEAPPPPPVTAPKVAVSPPPAITSVPPPPVDAAVADGPRSPREAELARAADELQAKAMADLLTGDPGPTSELDRIRVPNADLGTQINAVKNQEARKPGMILERGGTVVGGHRMFNEYDPRIDSGAGPVAIDAFSDTEIAACWPAGRTKSISVTFTLSRDGAASKPSAPGVDATAAACFAKAILAHTYSKPTDETSKRPITTTVTLTIESGS